MKLYFKKFDLTRISVSNIPKYFTGKTRYQYELDFTGSN